MTTSDSSRGRPHIVVGDQVGDGTHNVNRWGDIVADVLVAEGVTEGSLDVLFVSVAQIESLNSEHMGKDGPTDVLAFPLDAPQLVENLESRSDHSEPIGMPLHLGDIVVCVEIAEQQAPTHAGNLEAELSLLVIHAVLHILGHDHLDDDERIVMQSKERIHLEALGFSHPEVSPT